MRGRLVGVQPNADALTAISELIDASDVRPTISTTLPLAEAQTAHEEIEDEHARGKVVLQMETDGI